MKKVNIGQIIKEIVNKKGLGVTEFAKQINCTRKNVYDIYERESIDTSLLYKISQVLDENLFLYYIDQIELESIKLPEEDIKELVIELRTEINRLKEE